nr:MAG TPA: IrrE N-terminal-like domain [Caudoviricetes sp.]
MDFNSETLLPYIPPSEYDNVATDFLERYFPGAISKPQKVPILEVARNDVGLDVQFVCLSEESDIYGITIFEDGNVEIYDPEECLYDTKFFKRKTVLIDPEAVKKTNIGCRNNTIAHECVHWFKHRMYYRMQKFTLPKKAKYCKCSINSLNLYNDEEELMEKQAIGIAPRILMPKQSFEEVARSYDNLSENSWREISEIAEFFDVSKQSVTIRLSECGII